MKLSIIIPVYNEEKTVAKVIDKVEEVSLPGITKEIIVINDCSTDNTKKALSELKNRKIVIL
ncbi:MAG: glycosyltransferase, partial [Planctomycetota bacterium]